MTVGALAHMLSGPDMPSGLPPSETAVYPIAVKWADHYGVDLALVLAVISVESSFRPQATHIDKDGKSSYGLMQLRLDTAAMMSPGVQDTDLFDPDLNISLGTKYLRHQLDRYGNVSDAAAAYNAGSVIRGADGNYINDRYARNVLAWVDYYRANLPALTTEAPANWITQPMTSPSEESPENVVPLPPVQATMFVPDTLSTVAIVAIAGVVLLLLFPRG